jgi:putative DNA primase/helicase
MRQDYREFWPTHKLWLGANHRPRIVGTDNGMWRRILLVPFTVSIPKEEQDRELAAKLREELPGILRWAVAGCGEWLREGLRPPEKVMMATESYRQEEDVLAEFIDDICELGKSFRTGSTAFVEAYSKWSGRPTTHKYLSTRMQQHGFESARGNKGRFWQGIKLRNEGDPS